MMINEKRLEVEWMDSEYTSDFISVLVVAMTAVTGENTRVPYHKYEPASIVESERHRIYWGQTI